MPFRLDNKIALITGGASGIGEATCRVFADAGATVIICDIDGARAAKLAAELPGGARAAICDITSEQAVKDLFQTIPRLDVLVNNAGIGHVGTVEETTIEDFERLMKVNVTGPFLMTRGHLPEFFSFNARNVG